MQRRSAYRGRLFVSRLVYFAGLCLPAAAMAVPEGPAYPSAAWTQREADNYAMVLQAPEEQVASPRFLMRWAAQSAANAASYTARDVADPSWLLATSSPLMALLTGGLDSLPQTLATRVRQIQSDPSAALALSANTPLTPVCATYALQCTGDPFDYPATDPFYKRIGERAPVLFYDHDCTRLSGHVWRPRGAKGRLPGVIIETGSIEAPETLYWWAAQLLARHGYVVMTFDVRGQGRSDFLAPGGAPGTDLDPSVFWTELVDAIDFFRSSAATPYPDNRDCAGTYPTAMTPYNPYAASIDPARLGLAGHSSGGYGVTVVQAYGAPGADPWPGRLDDHNPVDAVVAWDGFVGPTGTYGGYGALEQSGLPVVSDIGDALKDVLDGSPPTVVPRVPIMGQFSDYGAAPVPYVKPPDPEGYKHGFSAWQAAGVPVYSFTVRGASHYEWSLLPTFPATSWCPEIVDGQCQGGWAQPMIRHYTLAWLDRWLKRPGEDGYADADKRLLDDADWRDHFSYHFRSARDFPTRDGAQSVCGDIRAGCDKQAAPGSPQARTDVSDTTAGGGCTLTDRGPFDPLWLLLLAAAWVGVRHPGARGRKCPARR